MGKKIGVLFSSGLDSTYLVWDNLKNGNEVVPIYIEITNNDTKTILEKNRIKLMYKKFTDEFENKIKNIEYVVTAGICASEDSLHFKQVPVWILGLMFCQSMGFDEIQIGYVGNDDAISYLDDIQKIYKSYKSIQDNLVPLTFPLRKTKKDYLASQLPKQYLDLIFSCENPRITGSDTADFVEYVPCGRCVPCKTIINTEYYGLGFPEKYKDVVINLRIEELSREGYVIMDCEGNNVNDLCSLKAESPEPYQLEINFNDKIEEHETING